MRCPIIVGREGLLSLLASAVRRLRAEGRGGALVLVGASPKADGILFTLAPVVLPVRDGGKRTQPVG